MTLLDRMLRVPVLYKVLIANSGIVVAGAIAGTYLTVLQVQRSPQTSIFELIPLFAGAGLVISAVVNYLVLRAAFRPLGEVERAVEAVSAGDLSVRIRRSRLADTQIDHLITAFNSMLDDVQTYSHQVSDLSSQVLNAQEAERKRIARELHDETAQSLTSLLVRLRMAERASSLDEIRSAISVVRELTGRTLDEVRNMALDLRPSALDDLGLVAALNWYTRQYAEAHSMPVRFEAIGIHERLPSEVEVVVYRVVQEALTNAAKHSGAHTIAVQLRQDGGLLSGLVKDDGKGFDVHSVTQTRDGGLGLFGMQERLALVGGRIQVDSEPGSGTQIRFELPLSGGKPNSAESLPGGGRGGIAVVAG